MQKLVFLPFLTAAAFYDFKFHIIPNAIIILALPAGSVLRRAAGAQTPGPGGLLCYLSSFLLASLLLLPLFLLPHAGGGDWKLTALIVTWFGPVRGCRFLLPGCLLALGCLLILRRTEGKQDGIPFAAALLLGGFPWFLLPEL